jgi:2-polyprenyl-3-methyl-5-hydroxy-6-metoxy-1,4-benzoquinol methylase
MTLLAVPPQLSQSPSLGQKAILKKQAIRERFDRLASERESWQRRASYYYNDQRRYLQFLIPEGLSILEIGCGLGDQLAALKPRRGLGIDLSEAMVKEASTRHPGLEFLVGDGEALALDETFDVILLVDLVGHVLDVEATLKQLRRCCRPTTRIVIAYYNFLWEPFLGLLEQVGLKMPQAEQNWLSPADIRNLLRLADYEIVKAEWRLLMPTGIPILSTIANRLLAHLPGLNHLCLCHYVVARMRTAPTHELQTVTVVIPCRNEKGNIEAAIVAYESSLTRQAEFPKLRTQSYLWLPLLIATRTLKPRYEQAMSVLEANQGRVMFPVDQFYWNAARALIFNDCGDALEARRAATRALDAAAKARSGLDKHPKLGLVGDRQEELLGKVTAIAGALS